jgi:hypothetical protein
MIALFPAHSAAPPRTTAMASSNAQFRDCLFLWLYSTICG